MGAHAPKLWEHSFRADVNAIRDLEISRGKKFHKLTCYNSLLSAFITDKSRLCDQLLDFFFFFCLIENSEI